MAPFVLHLSGPGWTEASPADGHRCWLKGQTYLDGTPIGVDDLASHLSTAAPSPQSLTASLTRLNGFYAWVTQTDQQLRAGVDHVRSRPLFHGQAGGRFFLADDAEWVRQQVGDQEMDPIAREEFQLAGYVTGADTLFPHVKQLQAGECLVATAGEGGIILVETQRYYRFLHAEPASCDDTALGAALDRAAVASVQRLIDYANGRQIVVPLSGGYDSRLIVTLLKRLGYDNVLTFTYGVPGNKESAYSKRVADALGLRWHFVEYSEALWREAWQTPDRWEYRKWGSGWCSLAHVQDWPAVKVLKEQGIPEPDCLFVPGHTGDFISGGHIPKQAFERSSFTLADATDAVFSKHYVLAPLKFLKTSKQTWLVRIHDRMERDGVETPWSYADVCEKWEWQERQAKFICNSVRVYEFFGYDWWMPLWDIEFVRFWGSVPLFSRRHRSLYIEYVKETYNAFSNPGELILGNASEKKPSSLRLLAKKYLPGYLLTIVQLGGRFMIWAFPKRYSDTRHLARRGRFISKDRDPLIRSGYLQNGVDAYHAIVEINKYTADPTNKKY